MTATQLEMLHARVKNAIGRRLRIPVVVVDPDDSGLWRRAVDSSVMFTLRWKRFPIFAMADRGGRRLVIPVELRRDGPQLWAAWSSEWKVVKRDDFQLVGVGWTIFFGEEPVDRKVQLFRAEWDHLVHRGGEAAQPHWQVDAKRLAPPLGTEVVRARSVASGGLVEITPPATLPTHIGVSRVHFGMGGWEHSALFPSCWQRQADLIETLPEWAAQTMLLIRHQASHVRLEGPEATAS